jgi:hypothetical protein
MRRVRDFRVQHVVIPDTKVTIGASGREFPCDGNGRVDVAPDDFADFAAGLSGGGADVGVNIVFADEPRVPDQVTSFQLRLALLEAGHAGTPAFALDARSAMAWLLCADANRSGPMVAGIMAHFRLDDAAMDALFITAGGIEA